MIATEAMYHKKCLIKLYNQFKAEKREEVSESEILKVIESKELSDVVDFVKGTVWNCHETNSTLIFTQKSLTDLYNKKLIYHGADEEFTKENPLYSFARKDYDGSTWIM